MKYVDTPKFLLLEHKYIELLINILFPSLFFLVRKSLGEAKVENYPSSGSRYVTRFSELLQYFRVVLTYRPPKNISIDSNLNTTTEVCKLKKGMHAVLFTLMNK